MEFCFILMLRPILPLYLKPTVWGFVDVIRIYIHLEDTNKHSVPKYGLSIQTITTYSVSLPSSHHRILFMHSTFCSLYLAVHCLIWTPVFYYSLQFYLSSLSLFCFVLWLSFACVRPTRFWLWKITIDAITIIELERIIYILFSFSIKHM